MWANGDITSPQKAAEVLRQTGADGVMVGRAAQGRPWLFTQIRHFLHHGTPPAPMPFRTAADTVLRHLEAMYAFYGEAAGARIARKHIGWYVAPLAGGEAFRKHANTLDSAAAQYDAAAAFLENLACETPYWPNEN